MKSIDTVSEAFIGKNRDNRRDVESVKMSVEILHGNYRESRRNILVSCIDRVIESFIGRYSESSRVFE